MAGLAMETKKCSKCGKVLPLTEFYKQGTRIVSRCKECTRSDVAESYRNNHQCIKQYRSFCVKMIPIENEIWKTLVDGNSLIYVSSIGRVSYADKEGNLYLYSQVEDKCGYLRIGGNRSKETMVHRLVVKAFISDIPKGFEVNHKDGNKKNNKVENLEIVTHKENMVHSRYVLGNDTSGMKGRTGRLHHLSKPVSCYTLDGKYVKTYGSIREAARQLNLSDTNISNICRSKRHYKTCGGYFWRYA